MFFFFLLTFFYSLPSPLTLLFVVHPPPPWSLECSSKCLSFSLHRKFVCFLPLSVFHQIVAFFKNTYSHKWTHTHIFLSNTFVKGCLPHCTSASTFSGFCHVMMLFWATAWRLDFRMYFLPLWLEVMNKTDNKLQNTKWRNWTQTSEENRYFCKICLICFTDFFLETVPL